LHVRLDAFGARVRARERARGMQQRDADAPFAAAGIF
jgi:hypothetical protein